MASVTLSGLKKSYGATEVLTGVDLDVVDGEYVVLVGPSGCGKSTLLRCIAGLEDITAGELRIGDRVVNDLGPRARDVAMVFQSYALYPHMTVRQNMGFALSVARRPKAEIAAAVDEVAALLDLVPLLDRTPAQLSGGQRQRVAMGRAIVRRPAVFLFDEPLSNLDASLRHHMRVELKRLHRRLGTTVFHVTHDQVEALTLADRILVLEGGVVQQVGTPRELFDTPANTFVATFIGSPSMALLPATGLGATSRLEGVEGVVPVPAEGPYLLGVRPTDVRLGEGPLHGRVDVVESLGAEALVHVELGPKVRIVAQVPEPCGLSGEDTVRLALGVVHRFDAESGRRLEGS
jgi:multiple sugar transport system ATP-binding protein